MPYMRTHIRWLKEKKSVHSLTIFGKKKAQEMEGEEIRPKKLYFSEVIHNFLCFQVRLYLYNKMIANLFSSIEIGLNRKQYYESYIIREFCSIRDAALYRIEKIPKRMSSSSSSNNEFTIIICIKALSLFLKQSCLNRLRQRYLFYLT